MNIEPGKRTWDVRPTAWVLVTDGAAGQARSTLAAVRALAAAGYRPAVTVSGRHSLAAASRHCARVIPVPPADEDGYATAVQAELERHRYLTVLPASDVALLALGAPVERLVDKGRLEEAATAAGLRYPASSGAASEEELLEVATRLDQPIVVKSLRPGGRARRLEAPADVRPIELDPGPWIVQPFVRGPLRSVAGLLWEGRLVASVHQRYLRTWPPDCGGACAAETTPPDEVLEDRIVRLLDDFEGIFHAQFVDDYLIDVNPRVYGSISLAVAAGVNLPALYCDLLRGETVAGTRRARPGVFYRWIEGDLRHLARAVRAGDMRTWNALVALRPRRGAAHAAEALGDPMPVVARLRHARAMNASRRRGSVTPPRSELELPALSSYAWLLLPADEGVGARVIEADERWRLDPSSLGLSEVVLWGGVPYRSSAALGAAGRRLPFRRWALYRLRRHPPRPFELVDIVPLEPPAIRTGGLRNALRDRALAGAVVRLARRPVESTLEAILHRAGATVVPGTFAPGADEAATVRGRIDRHGEVVFRMAPPGSASDPARAADALEQLCRAGVTHIPRVVSRGVEDRVSWVAEGIVPGSPARRLGHPLVREVATWCASLPRTTSPATSLSADLEAVAERLPTRRAELVRVGSSCRAAMPAWPGIHRHGDLWSGNVLVASGRLSGVIDWDLWHPSGMPGTDLLHLVASRSAKGSEPGQVWLRRPWQAGAFTDASAGYWAELDLRADEDALTVLGLAWWAAWIAGALRRHPRRAADEAWVSRNVDAVLRMAR